MAGRKSVMVDTSTWEKIDSYKHDIHLRNVGDAVEDAIDIVISDVYYAGVYVYRYKLADKVWPIKCYIVEALGRTEEETIRNLLLFEQGSLYGDVHAEDIPSWEDFNEEKDNFFVIECEKELYYDILRFTDVNKGKSKKDDLSNITLYSCNLDQYKPGFRREIIHKLTGRWEDGRDQSLTPEQWVLVSLAGEILAIGSSEVELHRYFKNSISNGELKFNQNHCSLAVCNDVKLVDDIYHAIGHYYAGASEVHGCFARRITEYEGVEIDDGDSYCPDFYRWDEAVSLEQTHYAVFSVTDYGTIFSAAALELLKEPHNEMLSALQTLIREDSNFSLAACGDSLNNAVSAIPGDCNWELYDLYSNIVVGVKEAEKQNDEKIKGGYFAMRCSEQFYNQWKEIKSSDIIFKPGKSVDYSDAEDLIADVADSEDGAKTKDTAAEEKSEEEKND